MAAWLDIIGSFVVAALLGLALAMAMIGLSWYLLLTVWLLIGLGYSAVLTPSGRLLRRSAHAEDRPAVFAAQFALSHACWLVTYPLSGWMMTQFGPLAALITLALLASAGVIAALRLWPRETSRPITHAHPDLPQDHPHLREHGASNHFHELIIDDLHRRWPRAG